MTKEVISRRGLIASGSATSLFLVAGKWLSISPAEAQSLGFDPQILSTEQADNIAILADALVPGAKVSGIAPYIDAQLYAGQESLLIAKYMGVDPPNQPNFYRTASNNTARELATGMKPSELIEKMFEDSLPDWIGAPAPYVLAVVRADALDVTYGSPEGFQTLGVPYMAHIMPESIW